MKPQKKLDAKARQTQILTSALALATKSGYSGLMRTEIAAHAGVAPSLISYHFSTMPDLLRAVMREAVRTECLPVIAQGVAARNPHALKAPSELRERALLSLAK